MLCKHKRDCPLCNKPGLRYISDHLRQVHNLYGDQRKKWLGRARFETPHSHNSSLMPIRPPAYILQEMRCVRKKTSSVLKPTKSVPKVTTSLTTKPYPEFNFRHKCSLMVVGARYLRISYSILGYQYLRISYNMLGYHTVS
jgi:hypothetical protein